MKKLGLTLLLALILLWAIWNQLTPASAVAATPTPIVTPTLEPTIFTATVDSPLRINRPGETVTYTLQITNTDSRPDRFYIVADVNYGDEFPLVGISRDRYNPYYTAAFELEPSEHRSYDIAVKIPNYATQGMVHRIKAAINGTEGISATEFLLTTIVSQPTTIESVAHIGISPSDIFVQGNYAYLAAGVDGLRILDISYPTKPVEVGVYIPPNNILWDANRVVVRGKYAYVAAGQAGLRILDISNPTQPIEVGFYNSVGEATEIKLADDYAYVTWNICDNPYCTTKFRILDISNPTQPIEVSLYDRLQICDIAIANQYAYIATCSGSVHVLDISNPISPIERGSFKTGNPSIWSIIVANDHAYVTSNGSLLVIGERN